MDVDVDVLTLDDGVLKVDIDPGRGCDILQIVHGGTGAGILAVTPWRARADAIRAGAMAPAMIDPTDRWMEQYRGGWQTLCPNAGPPRLVGDALVGFHGEASVSAWEVVTVGPSSARFSLALHSVPVTIRREIVVDDGAVRIEDVLSNTGPAPLQIDYVSHPAFGGGFLDGRCTVDAPAESFTADDRDDDIDLHLVPPLGSAEAHFGWLAGTKGLASITNHDLGLRVRLEWDPRVLPFAWWWQELNGTPDYPWFGRARIMAIEPSSTVTSGAGRAQTLRLDPGESRTVAIRLVVETAPFEEEQA